MIAVDTSALLAILLDEPLADDCDAALNAEDRLLISAGTLTEALIVAQARNRGDALEALIAGLGFEIVPVDGATARRVAAAHARWGRGARSAGLNFGDCFAYDVAKQNRCALLYVGRDFAK
ncbi:MAG TPA: type II toxin-antitoxin system VapC family toxin, partial [Hyphomicrobium sp.]|nr:type II toxin-antitoxin system VapC family toxin [Hyphomicrobium sp.]